MNKLTKRLLTFFIGLPLIIVFVILDFYHHLPLNLLAVFFSIIGAYEFYNMASKKIKMFPKVLMIFLASILPAISYIFAVFSLNLHFISWVLVFSIIILMAIECFTAEEFSTSIEKIGLSTLLIFYCGFAMTFITRITTLANATQFLILYFILVFMCDSGAWFFGMLFGKSTRGFVKASPNKSLVGFIGGIITSVACGIIMKFILPEIFTGGFWKIILLSLVTALAAITGDLIESVFKRSCDVKDSGRLIPGRGGALDCLDSLLVAAPVFYITVHSLFFV